jgi:hypothetical protein
MISQKRHNRSATRRPVLYWALISFILIVVTALLMLIMEVVDIDVRPWDEQRAIPSSFRANRCDVEDPRLRHPGQLVAEGLGNSWRIV